MKSEILFNSKKIIDKEFTPSIKGYRAIEVDEFLDLVAGDYDKFEQVVEQLKKTNETLVKKNEEYFKQILDLETKNAVLNNKVSAIKDDTQVSISNLDLLNKIKKLEDALFKAGIDPTKI